MQLSSNNLVENTASRYDVIDFGTAILRKRGSSATWLNLRLVIKNPDYRVHLQVGPDITVARGG